MKVVTLHNGVLVGRNDFHWKKPSRTVTPREKSRPVSHHRWTYEGPLQLIHVGAVPLPVVVVKKKYPDKSNLREKDYFRS